MLGYADITYTCVNERNQVLTDAHFKGVSGGWLVADTQIAVASHETVNNSLNL